MRTDRPTVLPRMSARALLRESQKYHFRSSWRVEGQVEELASLLLDVSSLPSWWSTAFFKAHIVDPGDECSVGRSFDLVTRGWLPYRLRFQMRVKHIDFPRKFVLVAKGDFVGRAVGKLHQDGQHACITFDWRVSARKPLLQVLSPMLRPILMSNHYWVMGRGQQSVRTEIARRRLDSEHTTVDPLSQRLISFLGFRALWPRMSVLAARSYLRRISDMWLSS